MAECMNYVVAHPWPDGRLAIYAYGSEVQHGTEKDARAFLAYVKRQEQGEKWGIYRVDFTPIAGVPAAPAGQQLHWEGWNSNPPGPRTTTVIAEGDAGVAAAPAPVEQPCQDCGGTGLVDTSGFGDMATCEECRGRGTSGVDSVDGRKP